MGTVRNLSRAVCALALAGALSQSRAAAAERVVEITAKRFEFSPREVTLKRGETVRLQLHSEDVVHGFFQRKLGIDTEIEPGKTTEVVVTPAEAGRFLVICHHFCGSGHGGMNLVFVVE